MNVCKNCGTEFHDAFERCPDCNAGICDLPEEKLVHLTNVSNELECSFVLGLLKQAGIMAVKKAVGMDETVGFTLEGIEILVVEEDFEVAYQLLNSGVDEKALEDEELESEIELTERETET
ncbi:putative signal transducing protein [Acetivibrio cellulolyticus]|uniref:putative signal transducing protein n=1 Tax=Acetivibrio cellulolyticus TaxID=35830 RepID=UPI0001E2D946|nr:DUF2007 domain-containing protein [Acetivibrio cellulolyticus]